MKALQEERIETLTQIARLLRSQYEQGAVEFRRLADAQMELVKAKVECADSVEDSVALLEELLAMAKGVLDVTETRHRAGFRTSQIDVYEAKSLYLNIKIRLVRARAKLKRPAK